MTTNLTSFESKPEWVSGRIKVSGKGFAILATVFAVFVTLIAAPIGYFSIVEQKWVGMVFPVAALFTWWVAAQGWYRAMEFGSSEFVMDETPVRLGDELRGVVQLAYQFPPDEEFELQLFCSMGSSDRKGDASRTYAYRSEKMTVKAIPQTQTEIPVQIAVPDEANESGRFKKKLHGRHWRTETFDWSVTIVAKQSGFLATYGIPVFGHVSGQQPTYHQHGMTYR